jgi:hypothetical protein
MWWGSLELGGREGTLKCVKGISHLPPPTLDNIDANEVIILKLIHLKINRKINLYYDVHNVAT